MKVSVLVALAAKLAAGQDVIELARKAPPEIFADAVIKLAEGGHLPVSHLALSQKSALLAEAFEAAKHAREPVRLKSLAGPGTRAALRDAAGALGLDALSLESRALKLLAAVDPAKARELFQSIDHPDLRMRPCEDPMIADASAYYEMAELSAAGQAPLLMQAVSQANSPGELAAFAKILGTASGTMQPEDLRLLEGALALKMEAGAADYRVFVMSAFDLREGLDEIAARAHELGIAPPVVTLAEGLRKLILTQMTWPRCDEDFSDAMGLIEWFNGTRSKPGFRGRLDAIEKPDIIPPARLGRLKAETYFDTADGKQISEDFSALRNAVGKPEWRPMLAEFLKKFSEWTPAGENIDTFHQKMTVIHGLYQLVPAGEDRDALVARTVELLRSGSIEREYPGEWLLEVKSLADSPVGDRARLLAAFRGSGDAGLEVFAALDTVH